MDIKTAQKDMRVAYFGGSTGVFASALIWLTAGIVAVYTSQYNTIIIFFFGGMLIHPIGLLFDKLLGRSGKHHKENPLGILALESTMLLFIGLFIAFVLFFQSPQFFFPIMLMIIGGGYLIFQTIYGIRWYWILGSTLILAGMALMMTNPPFNWGGLTGGVIELVFALVIGKFSDHSVNDIK